MGLFSKSKKVENTTKIKEEKPNVETKINPMEIIKDVQNHLHISRKIEKTSIPNFISFSKIPDPEQFLNAIDDLLIEEEEIKEDTQLDENIEDESSINEVKLENEKENTSKDVIDEEYIKDENPSNDDLKEDNDESSPIEEQQEEIKEVQPESLDEEETKPNDVDNTKQENIEDSSNENSEDIEASSPINDEDENKEVPSSEENNISNDENKIEEEPDVDEKVETEEKKDKTEMPKKSSTITGSSLKKGTKIVKLSDLKSGGLAAIKKQQEELKAKELAKKKAQLAEKQAKQKAIEKQAELERLSKVILIGKAKSPNPSLGKYEIQKTNIQDKPYKFVLKNEQGKVLFETSPVRTKPNELTAVMFRDILEKGSFTFVKNIQGYFFRIMDARGRLFYTSKIFKSVLDAQKAAALIKKYGLSANYIDDTTL